MNKRIERKRIKDSFNIRFPVMLSFDLFIYEIYIKAINKVMDISIFI